MDSSAATVSSDKQNNDSSGASLVHNERSAVRIESRKSRRKRGSRAILLVFLLLFLALFVIMTALFVIEKRKQIEGIVPKKKFVIEKHKKIEGIVPKKEFVTPLPLPSPPKICTSINCVLTITELMKSINPRKDPCENFYDYACEGWVKANPVPVDRPSWDQWTHLEVEVENFLKEALVDESTRKDYENVSAVVKSFEFYDSCVNLQEKAKKIEGPIIQLVNKYVPWPVNDPDWKKKNYSLNNALAKMSRELNLNPFLQLLVQSDLKNSSLNIITIQQSFEFGLFHNQLIKNFSGAIQARAAYQELIYNVSLLLGAPDKKQALKDAVDILAVEKLLARTGKGYIDFDEELYYGKFKLSDFIKKAGNRTVNWLVFLNEVFRGVKRIKPQEDVIVTDLAVVLQVLKELEKLPERTIFNYLGWRIIFKSYKYVSKEYDEIHKLFRKNAWGVESFSLVEGCSNKLKEHFGMAISRIYIDKKFPGNSKKLAQELADSINQVFQETLENSEWMDEKSKNAAIEKAKAVRGNYGYPDYVLNNLKLGEIYKQITIFKDSLLDSLLSIQLNKRHMELSLLEKGPDKSKWIEDPLLVNPHYAPLYNTMSFPAAFLQPPFYDKKYIRAVSFGGVGAIIAHELIHGFDDTGKNFDKNGNNVKWWSDKTLELYKNRTQCLVDQYNNFVYEGLFPIDGESTLPENIADNVGMREAFKAYQRWVEINGEEPRLPGTLFDNQQVFFLSFARMWCKSVEPFYQEYEIFGPHSPSPFRVNGPLQNSPEFSKVFNCPKGSYMNPEKKCSTW